MPVTRRTLLGLGLVGGAAALTGCADPARTGTPTFVGNTTAAPAVAGSATAGPDPSAHAGLGSADPTGPSPTAAGGGTPISGEIPHPALTDVLRRYLKPTSDNPGHPSYAGAVAVVTVAGRTVARLAVGDALRYAAGPVELPAGQRVPMRPDSIHDLASITKVHTAILALRQVDAGRVDLDAPVVEYLPEFDGPGKTAITVAMLLTHTSGLPVGAKISQISGRDARWQAVLTTGIIDGATPGDTFRYSSVGLMVLGRIIEKVTGQGLAEALRTGLTGPLGLADTGYTPTDRYPSADIAARMAATDARSSRGLLRGIVHDDVANQLGGIAGHAGIFATADDVAAVGNLLLGGGSHNGVRILSPAICQRMLTNANTGLPAIDPERPQRTSDHGLGVVLNQPWFMGALAGPRSFGHTGFSGTSLVVDPDRKLVFALLTNRAHPNWSWANPDPARVAAANIVARDFG
ncbi:serine hydrolase domain-containing protein [Micromonospora sp. NBC_01813]|uniref:serine hydrolase domain-containing protein n=1 Tax=Micromonospora sp. NBC_01813 TaxID=2975988 RepID=UPI002DD91251|nr:serine hydrolase domain-containing protein [Micromonospora sp. NBC_01813]WSA06308.1 beta-lactamase family protein [Micromonospora sp. NBC_01813]